MNMHSISVVLPMFNAESTIEDTLKGINDQINVSLEVIIIDDGSTDESLRIVKMFPWKKTHTIKIVSRENKGFLFSVAEGVEFASHEFIARVDADDVWKDSHLTSLLKRFSSDKDLVLSGSQAELINEDNEIVGLSNLPLEYEEIKKYMTRDNPFIHSSVVFLKSAYMKVGGYGLESKVHPHVADYHLWLRLSLIGRCENYAGYTLYYRVTDNSMSRSFTKRENILARQSIMYAASLVHRRYFLIGMLRITAVWFKYRVYENIVRRPRR